MDVSITEAAELLGVSARTLRARVARGAVPARKVDGAWRIARADLPLTGAQRARMDARADTVRTAVERTLTRAGSPPRTLMDLDAFRHGLEVLAALRSDPALELAAARLEQALVELAGASHTWDRAQKLSSLARSRATVGEAAALILLRSEMPHAAPTLDLVGRLEGQVSPALAGLARWVARRDRAER